MILRHILVLEMLNHLPTVVSLAFLSDLTCTVSTVKHPTLQDAWHSCQTVSAFY